MNRLYYGDNFDVLRRHVQDESVDLVYLDPPFNSAHDYNILFAERDGTSATALLDPFCGCGTMIVVAQEMRRHWIGIDITSLAIGLIRYRLDDAHGEAIKESYKVIGEPVSVAEAEVLAASDQYQFQ